MYFEAIHLQLETIVMSSHHRNANVIQRVNFKLISITTWYRCPKQWFLIRLYFIWYLSEEPFENAFAMVKKSASPKCELYTSWFLVHATYTFQACLAQLFSCFCNTFRCAFELRFALWSNISNVACYRIPEVILVPYGFMSTITSSCLRSQIFNVVERPLFIHFIQVGLFLTQG